MNGKHNGNQWDSNLGIGIGNDTLESRAGAKLIMWSADHAKCCSQPTYKHSSLVHWYPQTNQSCSLVKHSFIIALPFGAWQFFLCRSGFSKAPWLQGAQELSCFCLYVTPTCLWPLPGWSVKASTYYIFPTWRKSREEVTSTLQVQPSRQLHPFALIKIRIYIYIYIIFYQDWGWHWRHRGIAASRPLWTQVPVPTPTLRDAWAHFGRPCRDTEGHRGTPRDTQVYVYRPRTEQDG